MTDDSRATRRTFTKGLAATALLGSVSLAGCSGGGGGDTTTADEDTTTAEDGNGGGEDGGSKPGFDGWLEGVSNYDGVQDETGSDAVTVTVGSDANGGAYGFTPAAMKVSTGTTVTFEWTGEGGQHNVVDQDGAFESDLVAEAGVHFEHTFSEAGTVKYYCAPHKALGMKGVVIVE